MTRMPLQFGHFLQQQLLVSYRSSFIICRFYYLQWIEVWYFILLNLIFIYAEKF
jgi:hypothetical protein